jgi:hypothetical protein
VICGKRREDPEMKSFAITIERQTTQTHIFEIEAENADEARELAEDEMLNIDPDDWDPLEPEEPEIRKVVELSDGLSDADESEDADEAENEAV